LFLRFGWRAELSDKPLPDERMSPGERDRKGRHWGYSIRKMNFRKTFAFEEVAVDLRDRGLQL